jgi:hypothetical protein
MKILKRKKAEMDASSKVRGQDIVLVKYINTQNATYGPNEFAICPIALARDGVWYLRTILRQFSGRSVVESDRVVVSLVFMLGIQWRSSPCATKFGTKSSQRRFILS